MKLGASASGATMYYEPAPCVPLNNAEAVLAEQEEGQVRAVLGLLSGLVSIEQWGHHNVYSHVVGHAYANAGVVNEYWDTWPLGGVG